MMLADALMLEANETNDRQLKVVSGYLAFIAGIIIDTNDMDKFSELVSMFTAKKILDGIEESSSDLRNYYDSLRREDTQRKDDNLNKDENDSKKKDEEDGENSEDSDSKK